MTSLSSEHTLLSAVPILVVLAVISAVIISFPKTNLDNRSRASGPQLIPNTSEKNQPTKGTEPSIYPFPQTLE